MHVVSEWMDRYKTEATVSENGGLMLHSLPFSAGERVEILISRLPTLRHSDTLYPLRGTSYRFDQPTDPVADDHWEATE